MASNPQDNVNLAQGAPTVAVGQSLKTAREATGKTIAEVAVQLRIRQPFLEALEDGRHKDLPGGTYAVGFLRTYAEFLGLDGEEMVRRFRAEAAGELDARSELLFPSPVSEGRIPGGAILFLGLVLAGLGYGVWYWVSSSRSDVAEMVPPLPERLSSVLNRPATVTGDTAKPGETAKSDETAPASGAEVPTGAMGKDTEVVPPQEDEDEQKPAATSSATTPAGRSPNAAVPVTTPTPATVPTPATAPAPAQQAAKTETPAVPKADPAKLEAGKQEPVKPAAPAQSGATAPNQQANPAATTATNTAAPASTTTAPAPAANTAAPAPAAPVAAPAAAPVQDGKVLGQEHADSRILLKAASDDCWVQVREMDGQLVMSRLLRKGDSYMVPNRSGLTLMAGNAGALEISVDGKKAPSLGNPGQVRRDIRLDPDKLLSGG